MTQRIANSLPPWSDARQNQFSVAQQFLNPIATTLEDLSKYKIDEINNLTLTKANLDLLDVTEIVRLPNDFTFGRSWNNLTLVGYVPPAVKVQINNIDLWLTPTDNLNDFWYNALPTRITYDDCAVVVSPVLNTTSVKYLQTSVISPIYHASRLGITITGGTSFVDINRNNPVSFLVLTGITARDLEETEYIYVPYNGLFFTKKIWKSLTALNYFGITPDTTTVKIDNFVFNKSREVDKYQIYVTPDFEKLLYHKLGSYAFPNGTYSTLQQLTISANTLGEIYSGNDTTEVVYEHEALYNANNLSLTDTCIQPFTGRIFAIDPLYLYIFDPYREVVDCKGTKNSSLNASMIATSNQVEFLRGQDLELRAMWRYPSKCIFKNRWSIKKPDGSIIYLDINSDICTAANAWIHNQSYTDLLFGPFTSEDGDIADQLLTYTLTQTGTYKITLEVQFTDQTVQTNVLPIQVCSKTALCRITLPASLQSADGITFDADQKLWFHKDYHAYRSELHYDNFLIDFDNKLLYLHEDYGNLHVVESDDYIVRR